MPTDSFRSVRAAVCHEVGSPLRIETLRLTRPAKDEVTVATRACAICHSDIAFAEGAWGAIEPTVFGHEIAGVVEEAGPGSDVSVGESVLVSLVRSCGTCPPCRAGRRVLCEGSFALDRRSPLHSPSLGPIGHGLHCGGFADHVTVHASQVVRIPADVPFPIAAVVACAGVTGIGAVRNTAKLPDGQNVVVIGAGGVGLNTLQAAALCAPRSLIALDVSEAKLPQALRFGASDAIAATGTEAVDRVRERTAGRGADFVFVTVGAASAVAQGIDLAARGGTVVLVGMPATGASVALEAADIAAAEIRILGSRMGSTDLKRDVPEIFEDYRRGQLELDELVTSSFPLSRINEAFAAAKHPDTARVVIDFEK